MGSKLGVETGQEPSICGEGDICLRDSPVLSFCPIPFSFIQPPSLAIHLYRALSRFLANEGPPAKPKHIKIHEQMLCRMYFDAGAQAFRGIAFSAGLMPVLGMKYRFSASESGLCTF